MDKLLYQHLLRKIVTYPVTFSRNKNFDSYDSVEGNAAIKRAKVMKFLIKELENNDFSCEKKNDNIFIKLVDKKISLEEKYILNSFELALIMENIDNREVLLKLIKYK